MRSLFQFLTVPMICVMLFSIHRKVEADVVWNEAIHGDLSSLPASPTAVNFSTGSNTVIATLSEPDGDLRDYMTFTIGPNQFLTGLTLDAFAPDGVSFHSINAGSTSYIPGEDPSGNFLGLEFVFDGLVGMDLLPELAFGSYGSTGFTVPLGPGTYSYLIQEVTPGQARSYQISFHVVPEPSSVLLIACAGVISVARRGRRS